PGSYMTDTSSWYKITGTYKATGGEEWITIGCFVDTSLFPPHLPVLPNPHLPSLSHRAYFFIDDVSVTEILPADTIRSVKDTTVCIATGLQMPLQVSSSSNQQLWNTGATGSQIIVQDTGTYWCVSSFECGLQADTFHIRYQEQKIL